MGIFLSFVFFWIGIMALIGIALWLVPRLAKAKKNEETENKEEIQDIADE